MFWSKVKAFFVKVWSFLKKIPYQVWVALVLVGATAYYFLRKGVTNRALLEIQSERLYEQRRKEDLLKNIAAEETEELAKIEKEYLEKIAELDEEQKILTAAAEEGPRAISDRWLDYWESIKS